MQAIDLSNLEIYISKPRLQSYSTLTGTSDLKGLSGAYLWNKRVSAAVYPIIQCLEVSLRNSIHKEASTHFNAPDWFDQITKLAGHTKFNAYLTSRPNDTSKLYRNGGSSGPRTGKKIWTSNHEQMLKRAKNKLLKDGKRASPDAVVAELMFGFWVGLFEGHYSDILSNTLLWPHLERKVFPNLAASTARHQIIKVKLEAIKALRNRLSHHEPVWKSRGVHSSQDAILYLNDIVNDLILIIGGISNDRARVLVESGVVNYFRGICSEECLRYYIVTGGEPRRLDRRRLKRELTKSLANDAIGSVVVEWKGTPKFIVGIN